MARAAAESEPGLQAKAGATSELSARPFPDARVAATNAAILLVFTTTCPYSKATLPIWAALGDSVAKLRPGRVSVVAISLDSLAPTRAYAAAHALPYPVTLFPDWRTSRLYRADRVPATVVLNHEGQVLYARIGLLDERRVRDSIYAVIAR